MRRGLWATAAAATLLSAVVLLPSAYGASTLTNPGFEANGGAAVPSGWSESGNVSASYSEAGGRSGGYRLAHWSSSAYQVTTYQTLDGLSSGSYTARAWVRSGGGQRSTDLALRDCGGAEARANLPGLRAFERWYSPAAAVAMRIRSKRPTSWV